MGADDTATLWNQDRQSLHGLIGEVDPALAGLYRQAILLMDSQPMPGDDKARLSLVSHCVRELMNNLPDALGDVKDFPANRRGDEEKARADLIAAVEMLEGMPRDQPVEAGSPLDKPGKVTVPADFLDAAVNFAGVFKDGETRVRLRDSAALLGYIDRYHPALKPWKAARDFFMSFAHLDRHKSDRPGGHGLPTDERVMAHIAIIEASMRVRLGAFFDSLNEVRALAGQANEVGADGIEVPSDDDVRAILARLGSLQLRRAFYAQFENPYWVGALAKQDAFGNPPATEVMPDGTVRSDPWPEIGYLVRMAPVASIEVGGVLERIADSSSQWVRRGIAEAATVLAPEDAAGLVPKMKEWPGGELANFRIDPNDITQVIVRLLGSTERAKGRQLANAYFTPRPPSETPKFGSPEPVAGIDSYWYAEGLPAVAEALGSDRVPALAGWLREYQMHSNSYAGERHYDFSHIWRSSIRTSAEHHAREIGDSLVDVLRSALSEETQQSTEPLARLLQDDQPLLRRLALDVLAEAIDQVEDKSDENTADLSEHEAELVVQAAGVLTDETFTESEYSAEYHPFIRACLAWRAVVDVSPFFAFVRMGPLALRDERRERFADDGDTAADTAARIDDYRKRWQHTMLTMVGAAGLPEDLREMLTALDAEYGTLEVSDGEMHFRSFRGPSSPIDAETMQNLSDDDLIEHLRSWHPETDNWTGPSHRGQGHVLAEALSSQPGRLGDRIEDLKTLRPTYIRSVIGSWREAIKAGKVLPWGEIVPLCEWVTGLGDDTTVASEGDPFDDDSDYRNLKFEVLQLLEAGLAIQPRDEDPGIGETNAGRIGAILASFSDNPEPTPEYEVKYGGSNMDPLTLSINTVRPGAIRALIRLVHRFPETDAAADALAIIDRHIAGVDASLAVAAAVGEGTGRLFESAHSWIEERVAAIFGVRLPTTEYQQVALSMALAIHLFHTPLLELLRRPILLMIEEIGRVEHVSGWRTHDRTFNQLIGDWILRGIIDGHLSYDDPLVQSWFEHADAELRGDALGHLAWLMTRWGSVPDDVVERVADLWDRRVAHVKEHREDAAELAGVYWLARSEKYEVQWWLPRLEYASSVVPDFRTRGMLGECLAGASAVDPDTALKVVENVLGERGSHSSSMEYDLMERAVPQVIASALDTGEAELKQRATDLMNRLGRAGYIDLQDRVEQLRRASDEE
jgi:hypothetical protein